MNGRKENRMLATDRAEFSRLITDVLAYYRQDTSRFVLDL